MPCQRPRREHAIHGRHTGLQRPGAKPVHPAHGPGPQGILGIGQILPGPLQQPLAHRPWTGRAGTGSSARCRRGWGLTGRRHAVKRDGHLWQPGFRHPKKCLPVEAQRLGQLLTQHLRQRLSGGFFDQSAQQIAMAQRLIGDRRAGGKPRRGLFKQLQHQRPVEQLRCGLGELAHIVQPGTVAEQVPQCQRGLALLAKLRPPHRHGAVIVQHLLIDQPMHQRGQHALAGGVAHRQGVGLPGLARLLPAGPQVQHWLAMVIHRQRSAASGLQGL